MFYEIKERGIEEYCGPHRVDAYPDPTYHLDPNPDPTFHFDEDSDPAPHK